MDSLYCLSNNFSLTTNINLLLSKLYEFIYPDFDILDLSGFDKRENTLLSLEDVFYFT